MVTSEVSLNRSTTVLTMPGTTMRSACGSTTKTCTCHQSQAERVGRLLLPDRHALQAAAHRLGHVGGVEQRERHHGADEAVDR